MSGKLSGVERIAIERTRQIERERYDAEHDALHRPETIMSAALAYIFAAAADLGGAEVYWPWDITEFKPSTPARDMEKAGALIAAAIDRIEGSDDD